MEKILEGIFKSAHPDDVKKAIISKVVDSAAAVKDRNAVQSVIHFSFRILLESKSDFEMSMTKLVLNSFIRNHEDIAVEFFNDEVVSNGKRGLCLEVLEGDIEKRHRWIKIVSHCLEVLKTTRSEEAVSRLDLSKLIDAFLNTKINSLEFCSEIAKIIIQNWNMDIFRGKEGVIIAKIINILKLVQFESEKNSAKSQTETHSQAAQPQNRMKNIQEVTKNIQNVTVTAALFGKIVSQDSTFIQIALNEIFKILSSSSVIPSVALAALLQYIHKDLIDVVSATVSKDKNIKDENMTMVLCRMIDWLSWPGVKFLENWISSLMKTLISVKKSKVVSDVIQVKISQILKYLFIPVSRDSALAIISYMLLTYQHSPQPFHQVVPSISRLIKQLETEIPPAKQTIQVITELMYTMVYQFTGFPDIYAPLMEALKNYPRPSEMSMKRWLSQSSADGQKLACGAFSYMAQFSPKKSETGKAGLVNLGNTCYMNSVIQVLYMLDRFRQDVINAELSDQEYPTSSSLQQLFAFLLLTERPAINPSTFYRVSRPPWFREGSQQDCSEFLKYLLDRIDQEDKSRSHCGKQCSSESPESKNALHSGLHQYFTGECRIEVKCLNCHLVSSRGEPFNDLPLSFPENSSEEERTFSLKGGDISRDHVRKRVNTTSDVDPSDTSMGLHPEQVSPMETNEGSGIFPSIVKTATEHSETEYNRPQGAVNTSPESVNLTDLLSAYLSSEFLTGQNQYRCDNCGTLQDAERKLFITSCPRYLLLTLKRFTYDIKTHTRSKVLTEVLYPTSLSIPVSTLNDGCRKEDEDTKGALRFVSAESTSASPTKRTKHDDMSDSVSDLCLTSSPGTNPVHDIDVTQQHQQYSLVGLIIHSGISSDGGHYYCYARHKPVTNMTTNVNSSDLTNLGASTSESTLSSELKDSAILKEEDKLPSIESKTEEDNWYLFNDSRVSFAKYATFSKLSQSFPRDTPYLFFYEIADSSESNTELTKEALHPDLSLLLEADNRQYLKEQELEIKRGMMRQSSVFPSRNWKNDDDNNDGPSGSCGGSFGGEFGQNNAGRFIF